MQFFTQNNLYKVILDIYKGEPHEDITDEQVILKTRLAAASILLYITEDDTKEFVTDALLELGIKQVLTQVANSRFMPLL